MGLELYSGPVIDAHHHLWDFSLGKHPWLRPVFGDGLNVLQQNYLANDYCVAATGLNIVATVHVEANWDPTDPLGETEWLDALDKPDHIAVRHIAYTRLADPKAQQYLEEQVTHARVTGIRDILTWHPNPEKARTADAGVMENTVWRRNFALLARYDLSFDLMISPWQMKAARQLAADFPRTRFVLNHCGSPMDRDDEGMKNWRAGMLLLSRVPNVYVKISNPVAYDNDWSFASLSDVINQCIDCFGPERVLFASDYPVCSLRIGFGEWFDVFRTVVASFTYGEQRLMFFGNANEIYRVACAQERVD